MTDKQTIILPDEIFMASLIAFWNKFFFFYIIGYFFAFMSVLSFEQLSAKITSKFYNFEKNFI